MTLSRTETLQHHDTTGALSGRQKAEEYAQKDEEDAVIDYNAPTHWWIISTLFPLIAGTFGPMASAFNICALAVDWRTTVTSNQSEPDGNTIPDPSWLLAVNGVSLAIAIIANFALLLQMADWVHFNIAAPVTIVGWFISSLTLIGLLAASGDFLPLPTALSVYSQAFYYACFAAALYLILALMLSATAAGVWVFRFSRGFKLTMSQRSLMYQTVAFLTYLLAAAGVYNRIEGWSYLDSVYFINVTLFTIGFGDLTPKTDLGRGLFFPMAVGGILYVGLIIASVRSLVLESGSRKISTRMIERARRAAMQKGDPASGTFIPGDSKKIQIERELTELERREQEFDIMRGVQRQAAHNNHMIALGISSLSFCFLWLFGAVLFWQAEKDAGGENWTYFESLYFTYVSLLTIGYGDFYPTTNSAKPVFVFWSLIALPTLTVLIGSISDTVNEYVGRIALWLTKHLSERTTAFRGFKNSSDKKMTRNGSLAEVKPPGLMTRESTTNDEYNNQAEEEAVQGLAQAQDQDLSPPIDEQERQDRLLAAAAGETYRLYLVMKAMKQVVQHLDSSPPRKYTFAEWSWFLKLINEDEADSRGHRRHWHPSHQVREPVRDHVDQVWSWMGQESPLMSTEDEPKWVLIKLIEAVEKEMKNKDDGGIEEKVEEKKNT